MNSLEVTKENFIGDDLSVKQLSVAENARLLVLSDSHGNYGILRKIILRYADSCDAIVFCGDCKSEIQNLLKEAFENEEFKKKLSPLIAFVSGNCDFICGNPEQNVIFIGTDDKLEEKKSAGKSKSDLRISMPEKQVLAVGTHKFFITHGHKFGVEFGSYGLIDECLKINADIALYGHTHIAKEEYFDGVKTINPGSCSKPRGGQKPGFAIVTVQDHVVDAAFLRMDNVHSQEPIFTVC